MNTFISSFFLADTAAVTGTASTTPIKDPLVAVIGFGVVFVTLALIFAICSIFGFIAKGKGSKKTPSKAPVPSNTANKESDFGADPLANNPDRQEIIAAISAAIAEDCGENIKNIKILDIKEI